MRSASVLSLAVLCLFAAAPAAAQQYPVKPIRFLMNSPGHVTNPALMKLSSAGITGE